MTDSSRRAFLQATAATSMISAAGIASRADAAEETKMSTKAFEYQHSPKLGCGCKEDVIDPVVRGVRW